MAHFFHFEHHRREALKNRQRFSVLSALMLMIVLSGVGVLVKSYSHAASSTTTDFDGYKINTSGSTTGPYSGATIQVIRNSNSAISASTANPFYINGLSNTSSGTSFTVRVGGATSYSGWSIKGSSSCLDTCSGFDPQTTNFIAGYTRTGNLVAGHVYHYRWIWEYLPPTAPIVNGSVNNASGAVSLSWGSSSQAGGAIIYNYYVYNGSSGQDLGNTRSYTTTLPCGTAYDFYMRALDQYGHFSSDSSHITSSTLPCPTPAPTPAPTPYPTPAPTPAPNPTPIPSTPTPKPVSATPTPTPAPRVSATPKPAVGSQVAPAPLSTSTPKIVGPAPKPGAAPVAQAGTASVDISPPSIPDGFTAAISSGGNDIALSWSASSDSSGVKGYNLERSTDQSSWAPIATGISETTFDDKTVGFNTHYYYRLTATDNPGNTSDYAKADATSTSYQANAGSSESILSSDDGVASVILPADALPSGADCSVVKGDAVVPLSKDQIVIDGPYQLLCKDADGNQIQSFSKPLTWKYQFKTALKGYGAPIAVVVDDSGKGSRTKSLYDKKLRTLTFSQTNGSQTMILASKSKGLPLNLIIGVLFVLGLFAGVFFFVLRRRQQANYSEYIRSKYYDI